MRYVFKVLNWFADCCFAWFTPSWRRKACDTRNALVRYYNYNRPHLSEENAEKMLSLRGQLSEALLYWRKEETQKTTEAIQNLGETLRSFKRGALVETVESFFVIMVIFLGIRTYYAQPFRIPTGSMQPTLNGITVHSLQDNEQLPAASVRWWQAVTLGSSYSDITAQNAKQIVDGTEKVRVLLQSDDPVYVSIAFRLQKNGFCRYHHRSYPR